MAEPDDRPFDAGIVVADLDAALRFYRDTLGLHHEREIPVEGVGRLAFLRVGGAALKLVQPLEPPRPGTSGGLGAGVGGIRYLTLHVDNLDALLDRCRSNGYRVVMRPRRFGTGARIAAVDDGEGTWIELAEAPSDTPGGQPS